ncbi:MAG: class E sortase [Candidatus Beckwithbacteria bacterium]|nr:class E sortase [Candidatus Beckwithbacteria bacterium]
MSVVVFSRKRNHIKKNLIHIGRGILLGTVLVLATMILLPFSVGKQQAIKRLKELKTNQITFNDLLRLDAAEALKVTPLSYFSLEIPKIGAAAKVLANVNSVDRKEYESALKQGVAHAAGTYLPGMGGSVTLFAHSTDSEANVSLYNAVFYRLDELVKGDEIIVWFLGEKKAYRVVGSEVVPVNDTSVFQAEKNGEKLYLVTCTPRGTTKNRLVVEAQ